MWCRILLPVAVFYISVQGAVANVLKDPYICGQPTCAPNGKFKYNPSVIYHYQYHFDVSTWFSGSSNNQSTLNVKCTISLEFLTHCEGLLRLTQVGLVDLDENFLGERSRTFADALSQYPLRFAFHDGVVTEVCPQGGEDEWVLNFKKAILSLIQNTMTRFDMDENSIERDIHGICNTDYTVLEQQNTSLIVLKTKDLTQCTDRYKYLSILQTERYNFQSKYQTWPVLKSESRCKLQIDHNIYKSATCRERHLFEPFSGKRSGAISTVIQTLDLTKEINKTDLQFVDEKTEEWEQIKRRTNLLHHHTPLNRILNGELKSARDVLKQLCRLDEMKSDTESEMSATFDENLDSSSIVGLWGNLVRDCRGLHHPALAQLLARAPSMCTRAKKYVMDALPYIASIGSVELIKDMIIKKTVADETREEWLMSLAMIPRPQKEMIVSMSQLVEHEPTDRIIVLTASSMVHSYCRDSQSSLLECYEEPQNSIIINVLQNNILKVIEEGTENMPRERRQRLTVSIKALGNIGTFINGFRDVLMQLIENKNIPMSIRLYAIDAFRKTPCFETREYFLHIFREDFVNLELRIAAYLQVMRCPDFVTIRHILHALKNEPVNQAASFVWSHLDNLGKSSLPSRVEIQGLLSGNALPRPNHRPDIRKFSKNYEQSVFFDQYNAGGNYESNVIFSPESYIPRSVSLNLTVDMFGESINLLEFQVRGEGFETYIEKLFGPNGPLSKATINDKLDYLRFLRSPNEADEVRSKIDDLGYDDAGLNHHDPLADLSLKVFGNEVSYWNIEGGAEIAEAVMNLNPLHHINKILSGKEISYKKASLFLDTTYSVPTGCGFPLTMNLMGTSVVNLKTSGSISGADNFFATKNLDFEGKINPSVSLNIAATMAVGAGPTTTGIRLQGRLYTSTAVEARLKLRGARLVELDMSLPHSKQEIFGAKSELLVLHGDKEVPQLGVVENRIQESSCSWSAVDRAIGIKVCASYQFPNMSSMADAPYFIMSGPAKYLVSLEKVDPTAKVYEFRYSWTDEKNGSFIVFSFDTPKSETKRKFNITIESHPDSGKAEMIFHSAQNTLTAKATYKNLPDNKLIESVLDIDGQKHFDAVMSLTKTDQKNGFIYIPRIYIAVNNERITELAGTLRFAQKKGVSQCDVSLEFQTKRLASRLIGYITWNGPSKGAKLRLDYQFLNERKETIQIEALLSNRALGARYDLYAELGLDFTSYPHLNFFTDVKYLSTNGHIELSANLSSSREMRDDLARVRFGFALHRKLDGVKVDSHLTLQRPQINMVIAYEEAGAQYNALVQISYSEKSRDIILAGRLYCPPGTQLFVDAGLNMTLPTLHPFSAKLLVHEKKAKEFDIHLAAIWFTGLDVNVGALYQDQSTTHQAAHRLKAIVTSTSFKDIATDSRFTQDNRQLNINMQANHDNQHYAALLRYVIQSEHNFTLYGQVDVKSKTYSINLLADMENNTNILADLHIDQIRDIHLTYQRWNGARVKKLNAEINWDANRDPSQKVTLGLELKYKALLNYGGSLLLFYPGRLINGEFDFLVKDWLCRWLVNLGWSPEDKILWKVKMYSEAQKETVYALLSQMDTPFQGWKDTSFNLMWRFQDNLQALNGSMTWQKDYLTFGLLGDYMLKTNEFYGEINAVVNSTIVALPKVAAIARHRHYWKKSADTLLSFQYNNEGKMMVNSSWRIDRNEHEDNVTGRVALMSPFQGYKKGLMRTKFIFNNKKHVQGITHLDLDEKVYTVTVDGHIRRITNSMFVFNVTSPSPSLYYMVGRFGFSDVDRHLVAEIKTPNSTTGIEVLVQLVSTQDFHVYASIALPVEFLQRAMVQAKRNKEEVDFRVGWDKMDFGFTGIWHYNSIADFQYVYKVYTPLDGFDENGLVLKNIYSNGLDSEVSIRLSKHRLGLALLLRDNGKGLLQLISDKYQNRKSENINQIIEDFSTNVYISLDTLYYPTVIFSAELNKVEGLEEEEIVRVNANLQLPNMTAIILKDTFILVDLTTMTNTMHLVTPFDALQELKSDYSVEILLGTKYNVTLSGLLRNGTEWLEASARVFYEHDTGEEQEYSSHIANLNIVTPLNVLPSFNGRVTVHIEDNLTRMSADVDMPSFVIAARGHIEMDESFIESIGYLNLTSPYLESYFISMNFKKDYSEIENTVSCGLQVLQGDKDNYFNAEAIWQPTTKNQIKFKFRGCLVPVLPPSDMSLSYNHEPSATHREVHLEGRLGSEDNFYMMNAEEKSGFTTIAIVTPHRGFRNMNLTAEVKNNDTIVGRFKSDTIVYHVVGNITNQNPLEILLTLQPDHEGESYTVRIKYTVTATQYAITASMIGAIQVTLHGSIETTSKFTDVYLKVDTNHPNYKDVFLKSRLDFHPNNRAVFSLQSNTPLQSLRHLKADADMEIGPQSGYVKCNYDMTNLSGDGDLAWSFIWEDMYLRALGHQKLKGEVRSVNFNAFYGKKLDLVQRVDFTNGGFHMDLDQVWQIGGNASLGLGKHQKIQLLLNAFLPKPNVDVHTVSVFFVSGHKQDPVTRAVVRYQTDVTKIIGGVNGHSLVLPDVFNTNVTVEWGVNGQVNQIDNRVDFTVKDNKTLNLDYQLTTPLHQGQDTFRLMGTYDNFSQHIIIINGTMWSPGSNKIGDVDLTYGGFKHTVGNFNMTTPFKNLEWLKANLRISNEDALMENMIEAFWPNKSALLNSTHSIFTNEDQSISRNGIFLVEFPLNTKHVISSDYSYTQAKSWSNGNATLFYNRKQFIQGLFNSVSEKIQRNLVRDVVDIEIENGHTPVGIHYIHDYDEVGNVDIKQASLYNLRNATSFNVTGKVDMESWEFGKTIKLMAIHTNRTLKFENNYEAKEKYLKQGSKIWWAPDVWINYDVAIENKTVNEVESQEIQMNVWYPRRSFNVVGVYSLQEMLLDGDLQLKWNVKGDNKTTNIRGKWENPATKEANQHNVELSLSHPSFRQDVKLIGKYISDVSVLSNISIDLEYSEYENEKLEVRSVLQDKSNGPTRDYSFELICKHPATNLDLEVKSDLRLQYKLYKFNNYYRYQKSLFSQIMKQNRALFDLTKNILEYEKNTESSWYKLNSTWHLTYPEYQGFVWVNRTKGNDTGICILSAKDMSIVAHFNRTDEISYHTLGQVNDARSAELMAWRDYDDVTTQDVSSYIRLNHSKLLTASFIWRPELYQQLKQTSSTVMKDVYQNLNQTLLLWKSIPMEMHSAFRNIWSDAKPKVRDFLDDLNDLHVIKDDFDEFKLFLNESYNNNDFYVKNLVEFSFYVIDQMSIRNHLENLPDIVNEMWVMMGDTGKSIRKSVLWVIETIKTSYANFMEMVNKMLEADFMDQVSDLMETAITKYDLFIKDVHLKLVRYWETTWGNIMSKLTTFWKRLLKSMEPSFLKLAHYVETFVWNLSKEIMDFFYARTSELTESPYFNMLTNFSQDVDKFWHDLKTHDAITNIKKYGNILITLINDKILVHIPFKKELQEIGTEIWNELNQLQELTVITYAKAKFWEAKAKMDWWYNYFQIGTVVKNVAGILHKKVTEIARTALQNEEVHREAKTNFVFDPNKGVINLEQKLPMSWHAFNRTPDFSEVQEYKMIRDVLDNWLFSNKSMWSYYYDFKPYADIHNVLPPFAGHAVMTGHGTLVTFDREVFTISQKGTFLLSKDYKHGNFTILMESNSKAGKYNLVLMAKTRLIHVDLYNELVTVGEELALNLPSAIDNWILDREYDSILIQNNVGVKVKCSFLFKTCTLDLDGFYFGCVGGLLGTLNNEVYDDMQTPKRVITKSPEQLAVSWRVLQDTTSASTEVLKDANATLCSMFFMNKVSPLYLCFSVVDTEPFYGECLLGADPCSLANAYLEICTADHVAIHIPEQCTQCTAPNGEIVEEGSFYELPQVSNSTDVVFIVEVQDCNRDIRKNKNIDVLISVLDTKLNEAGLTDNRYAIVGFGGTDIYKTARSLYINHKIFSPPSEIPEHFDHLFIGYKEDSCKANCTPHTDTFGALSYASDLSFRPGVSKTFVLMPCSKCDINHMKLDYSVVHQVLMDSSVTLHILMSEDFMLSKRRVAKTLYGVDNNLAYSMKDARELVGDAQLRQQVKLPKAKLGLCTSLAMETNGTIFTASKLTGERVGARRISTVLGARMALTAHPCTVRPTRCECHTSRLVCAPCILRHHMISDISMTLWDSGEVEEIIDNFLDLNVPSI